LEVMLNLNYPNITVAVRVDAHFYEPKRKELCHLEVKKYYR